MHRASRACRAAVLTLSVLALASCGETSGQATPTTVPSVAPAPTTPAPSTPNAAPPPAPAVVTPRGEVVVPPTLLPVVIPSAVDELPAYVILQARFNRVVAVGEGDQPPLFLEFVPLQRQVDDPRWHRLWFRPCENNEVVTQFASTSLARSQQVQVTLPVNPLEGNRLQLVDRCAALGGRSSEEADSYTWSLFATNLQTLTGDSTGIYLAGSIGDLSVLIPGR